MISYRLHGGEELRQISRQLRHVGNGREIRKQFSRDLRLAAKPLVPKVRSSIAAIPTSGGKSTGLRRRMQKATRLTVRTSGRSAQVSVRVDGRKMGEREGALPAYMEGSKRRWRHPVYGTDTWVEQAPKPYFQRAVAGAGAAGRLAIHRTLRKITREIT
ncbi:MAG: hypothetical protein ACRDYU_07455 [Actinomycetes bacterium]